MEQKAVGVRKEIFNKSFISVCLIGFAMMLGQNMVHTIVPKYADSMGASPTLVGVVSSFYAVSSLVTKPFSGQAADCFERKKVVALSGILMAVSFAGYGFSENITMLMASRLINGVGLAFCMIACLTMVSDTVSENRLVSGVAYYSVAIAAAQAIGPGIGLELLEKFGYRMAFFLGTAVMIGATVFALTMKTEKSCNKKAFRIRWENIYAREAVIPALLMLLLAAVYVNIASYLVLFAESIGVEGIGGFFSVNAVALFASRPLVGKASERIGIVKTLVIAITLFGLSMLMIGSAGNLPVFLAAAVLNAFGYGACQPLIQSICMKSVPADRRGSASATSYYGTDIGYLLGPILAGWMVEQRGYGFMFQMMGILVFPAMIFVLVFRKKLKQIVREQ